MCLERKDVDNAKPEDKNILTTLAGFIKNGTALLLSAAIETALLERTTGRAGANAHTLTRVDSTNKDLNIVNVC